MYCTKCGTKNEDNNAFCKNCGAKLVANNTESQSVAGNSGVANAHNLMQIKMIAGVAVVVIVIACSLMFIGTKIGEEDAISVDGRNELAYVIPDRAIDTASSDDVLAFNKDDADAVAGQDIQGGEVFDNADISTIEGTRLLKEQKREQSKESLLEIINKNDVIEEEKNEAMNSITKLTETAQKESDAEMLLAAEGFTNTVVTIYDKSADVMVEAENLTEAQTAQIIDIVHRKTDIPPENIIITVSFVK